MQQKKNNKPKCEETKAYAFLKKSLPPRVTLQTIYVQAWVDIEKPLKNVILQMKHIYIGRVGT
jgi:hypothetical protein